MSRASVLGAALVRELSRVWDEQNRLLFKGGLQRPAIEITQLQGLLGRWMPATRTLQFSRALVTTQPWLAVVEVLKHEMAHQYVHEVLKIHDESAHGRSFRQVCRDRAIDPSARGLPVVQDPGDPAAKVLRRIQRLLALAESDNQHEAEAAMNAAHRLMRAHNIAAAADAHAGRYGFAQLGEPTGRVQAHVRMLAGILAQHFFVRAVWVPGLVPRTGKRGQVLEVCGSAENLAIAQHVHGFLLSTCDRLWLGHKTRQGIVSNKERRRFFSGVMLGFHEKLVEQAKVCEQTGLVWVGDADLGRYLGRRHPRLVSTRATRVVASDAWHDGRAAGRKIVLHKPVSQDPTRRGRFLPGPRGSQ